jgi:AraC-like DNA-binding protein
MTRSEITCNNRLFQPTLSTKIEQFLIDRSPTNGKKNIVFVRNSMSIIEQNAVAQEKSLTIMGHEERLSDSPYIEKIGRIQAESAYSSICPADGHWNIFLMGYEGRTRLSVWGPMTKATVFPYYEGAEFLYLTFKLGVFMPCLPVRYLLDKGTRLPQATDHAFWLNSTTWQFPDFNNADIFVDRLVQQELLVQEPIVDAVLNDEQQHLSLRSVQRRFLQATGVTLRYLQYIERARRAAALLQQGVSILDTVYMTGYFDQAHLNRAMKRLMGQTPMQIIKMYHPP